MSVSIPPAAKREASEWPGFSITLNLQDQHIAAIAAGLTIALQIKSFAETESGESTKQILAFYSKCLRRHGYPALAELIDKGEFMQLLAYRDAIPFERGEDDAEE